MSALELAISAFTVAMNAPDSSTPSRLTTANPGSTKLTL